MALYYQVTLSGLSSAAGQIVENVFYYRNATNPAAGWTAPLAEELADLFAVAVVPKVAAVVANVLVFSNIRVVGIDERNIPVSPFPVDKIITAGGTGGGTVDGSYQCAILSFRVLGTAPGTPVGGQPLKRSYVAIGPLDTTFMGAGQQFQPGGTVAPDLEAAVQLVLAGLTDNFQPCRVGRSVSPNPPTAGDIYGASFRPFVSIRRSRMRKVSGLA